jgi:hypothetical protein
MGDLSMTVPGAVLFGAFLLKLPALRQNREDVLLRCVCALLLLAGMVFLLAAVPVLAAVNRITGVPNFAAPLVYAVLTALSAVCIVLVVIWRGGATARTRRVSQWVLGSYGVVIVALVILFALGDASVERLRDLDTYYASTPFIREMILLYLLAHTVAAVVTSALCWRWSVRVNGVLRAGLTLIVAGYLLNLGYDITKFAAIGARWAGHDMDWLSTDVARPVASASAFLIGTGFALPLVAQRLAVEYRTLVRYRQLTPLARLLADPRGGGPPGVAIGRWASMALRLTRREAAIHDGLIALRPYLDPVIRARVEERALAMGRPAPAARALAAAVTVVAAAEARWSEPGGGAVARGRMCPAPGAGAEDLVPLSLALREASAVRRACREAALSENGNP